MKNLTESDVFSPNITVPEDGDLRSGASVEVGFQGLANRTRHHKNRLDSELPALEAKLTQVGGAQYTLSASGVAHDANVLGSTFRADAGFTREGNEITLPGPDDYLISATGTFTCTSTEVAIRGGVVIKVGGTGVLAVAATRYSASAGILVDYGKSQVVRIDDPATQKVTVTALVNGGTLSLQGSTFTITRLRHP